MRIIGRHLTRIHLQIIRDPCGNHRELLNPGLFLLTPGKLFKDLLLLCPLHA